MQLLFQNDDFIANLIKNSHAGNGFNVEAEPMFNDFVEIGSLLTTRYLCLHYLAQLNDDLVQHAERMGVLKSMTTSKFFGKSHKLKTLDKAKENGKVFAIHKHHKVLTSFLTRYEGEKGFNTGALPAELQTPLLPSQLPKSPATLTRFVNPPEFRTYLFQYAYHWKDAGVGWNHGEFTHRIQWYIVLEFLRNNPNWLDHKPLELFRACALPEWRHASDSRKGVWDDIFDDGASKNTFRSPETLHSFLKDAADPNHADHSRVWFLAQLVLGRAAKRLKEDKNVFDVPGGAFTVAHDTIMWKEAKS